MVIFLFSIINSGKESARLVQSWLGRSLEKGKWQLTPVFPVWKISWREPIEATVHGVPKADSWQLSMLLEGSNIKYHPQHFLPVWFIFKKNMPVIMITRTLILKSELASQHSHGRTPVASSPLWCSAGAMVNHWKSSILIHFKEFFCLVVLKFQLFHQNHQWSFKKLLSLGANWKLKEKLISQYS